MTKRLCVVGPGFLFMSGISVYTWSLTQALAADFDVSVLLLRRLMPRRLYPGGERVGAALTSLDYGAVPHFDGIDWFWGLSLIRGLRFFSAQRPEGLILQWWTAAVGHTYLLLALPYHRVSSSGPLHIAMAQGINVIMTDLPALRSVAADYAGAEFVPPCGVESLTAALERAAYRPPRRSQPLGDWKVTVEAYRSLLAHGS